MRMKNNARNSLIKPGIVKGIILLVSGIIAFFILILPGTFRQSAFPMQIGDVATQDILAPYSLSFESEVLTDRARQDAASAVEPVYLPTDPSIGRRQVERLRTILYFISTVRQDAFASQEERIADIQAIEDFNLAEDTIIRVLQLSDPRWSAIESEATSVLEQIMRNTLRDGDIIAAKRNIPSLIDFSFPEDQANIVVELVEPLIVPNSILSENLTETAIEEARASVEPVTRSFVVGETLVRLGQIIREAEWEALQRYGLIQPDDQRQDTIGAAILTVIICVLIGLYFNYRKDDEDFPIKAAILVAITFLFFLGIARFFIIDRTILPYIYPLAAFGLTLSIIFNFEMAIILSLILGMMTAYGLPNGFDLTIFYVIPAFFGMLTLAKARRIGSFFISGLTIGVAGIGIILGYRLPDSVTDWIGIATLSGASLINGIGAASLTLLLQFVFSQTLGITTSLQLLDMSRPDHPLLQRMLRNAPGSYQHSLQVANLAEQAAEAIGADGLLVRVGAIYHDCGKASNPQFFIENQVVNQTNPHDEIDPYLSAQTIINHVNDGVNLAKKYNLPSRIIDFIKEHHGTMYTHYQYTHAIEEAEDPQEVDKSMFTYPGPRPQSRETALLMLADGTEARARAEKPQNEAELRALIDTVVTFYTQNKQLEDTNLTLRDLQVVKDSFFHTLKGSYHPRVKYPSLTEPESKTKKIEKPEITE
jgi:putative nucleotidyltransferase with HDIG domain